MEFPASLAPMMPGADGAPATPIAAPAEGARLGQAAESQTGSDNPLWMQAWIGATHSAEAELTDAMGKESPGLDFAAGVFDWISLMFPVIAAPARASGATGRDAEAAPAGEVAAPETTEPQAAGPTVAPTIEPAVSLVVLPAEPVVFAPAIALPAPPAPERAELTAAAMGETVIAAPQPVNTGGDAPARAPLPASPVESMPIPARELPTAAGPPRQVPDAPLPVFTLEAELVAEGAARAPASPPPEAAPSRTPAAVSEDAEHIPTWQSVKPAAIQPRHAVLPAEAGERIESVVVAPSPRFVMARENGYRPEAASASVRPPIYDQKIWERPALERPAEVKASLYRPPAVEPSAALPRMARLASFAGPVRPTVEPAAKPAPERAVEPDAGEIPGSSETPRRPVEPSRQAVWINRPLPAFSAPLVTPAARAAVAPAAENIPAPHPELPPVERPPETELPENAFPPEPTGGGTRGAVRVPAVRAEAAEQPRGAEPLVDMASVRSSRGSSEVQLLLRPEALGRVAVRLVERAGQLEVAVRSDNQPLRALLTDSLPSLIHGLHERGWEVSRPEYAGREASSWWLAQDQGSRRQQEQPRRDEAERRRAARAGSTEPVFFFGDLNLEDRC